MAWLDNALKGTTKGASEVAKLNEKYGFTNDWLTDSQRDITFYRFDGSNTPGSTAGKSGFSDSDVYSKILDRLTVKDSNNRSWLNKGLLEDGVDEDDIWKTILASMTDAEEDLWTGAAGIVEGVVDTGAMIAPVLLGTDKEKATDFVKKDLIDEQNVVRRALASAKSAYDLYVKMDARGYVTLEELDAAEKRAEEQYAYMNDRMEAESVLGEKLDSAVQSGGQLLATSALGSVGVPWWVVSGATAAGGEAESALNEGATYEEALDSAAISGAAEVLSEKLFSGIKFGGKAADEALVTMMSRGVSNKLLRNALKFGLDVTGEGLEEVATSLASEFGQWLTYRNDEDWKEVLFSEQAMDEKMEAFFSGMLMGGGSSAANIATSKAAGVDATSGLSANEEKVVNKLYKDRVAEAEKDGKVTAKQKNKIYDEVVEAMDKGEIAVEEIEDVLGGNSYREYRKAMDKKEDNDFLRDYDELGSKRGATPSENAQYMEMTDRAKLIRENRSKLQNQLRQEVSEMVKGDRLSESYRQKALRGVAFKADLTKVNEKQRAIYQKAMDSGVVNDTRRSHEFVDLVAKIAADKGVDFDFTNNERLKQSGFAVEGATVNGYVNENGVTINMQSVKALNKVVGHEVTHVLEGTDLYDTLQKVAFDYADAKGELTDRWEATKALYKDLDSVEINNEITADLVGDYLFGDKDFINRLYSGHRSTFEKIYDEIKYLCRVVTAGSKEARQLEKVKKAFADAYLTNTAETASVTSHENQQPKSADIVEQNAAQSGDTVVKEKLKEVDLEVDDQSGTVSFSLSSLEDAFGVSNTDYLLDNTDDTGFVHARQEYVDALAKSIAIDKDNPTEEERQKAERYMDSLFLIHDLILDDRDRLDYEAAVDKSAWVSNAEYGGSIDFSTLCAKRRLFTGTFDAIQNALPDTVLDENDFLQIRNMLLESDQESPCSMCYVEGSRAKHGVYVQKWLKEYLKTNPEWKPQIADFTSTTRLEQTRIQHPEAYKAYQDAMNKLSQRKPKEASVRTDYKGEILRDFKDSSNVEEKNRNGGVRFNSFSDFEVIHALDCMQVLTDMSRVGLNGQAYTKVAEFAECFGNTGLKINLSLVAKDVDANGKLIMDETNGMKYNEAMDLRNRYSDNVGTVIVVFNESQLKAALADTSIDYVLPFHRSQWKKSQYTMMGLPAQTKDFTNFQNDRIKNPKTGRDVKLAKIKHTSTFTNELTGETFEIKDNIMPNQYWDFDKSGRENAETYLNYINDNGMTPKFSFLLSKDASGKWALPDDAVGDGYFKLLIDFKMYNNDGWGSPQNPVVPDFNMDYIQKMLADYKGGHSAFPVANDVVDKFVKSKKAKYSLSEGGGNVDGIGLEYLTFDDIENMSDEQLERALRDIGYDFALDLPDEILLDEDLDIDDISEQLNTEPEIVKILYRRKGLGDSHIAENKTAVMTTKRIDQRIDEHGAGMTDYARRYITRISPKDFIDMTVYEQNMDREKFDTRVRGDLDGKMGDWDYAQQLKDSEEPPVLIIDKSTGQIIGHNGRHRMRALEMAGIESVEIEVELHDEDGYIIKYNSQTIPDLAVSSQFDTAIETHLPNVIPFNKAHRDEILRSYGENAHADAGVKYSLSPEGIAPVHRGNYNITSEELYFDASAENTAPVANDAARQNAKVELTSNSDELENLSPKDRSKKFFFDEVMSIDKMPESFRKKHGEKWVALQRATENAQNFVVHGAEGVKPLNDIYQRVVDTGAFSQFELYMQHQLNMDAMSLNQRFGLKDKDVIGGVTSEMSRQEVLKIEKKHPEFKELAQEIYDYNRFLRNVLVQSGKITQETADLWEQRYPHYIPIRRAGFGNEYEVSELLGFMIENMEQVPDADNMDGFFKQVEETAPLKKRKGSDLPIQPLFDTLTERAMQTYWAAAMNGADMRVFAPVRSDVTAPIHKSTTPTSTKTVASENVKIETEKSSDPKILDVDNEIMRKGKMNPIKWAQEFLADNGMVFERLAKKTKDRGLEAEWNFVRNARGAAQHLIGHGDQSKGVKALKDLFAEVKKTGAVEQFYEYLGHQRNLDGMTMRIRFGIPVNQSMMGRSAADSIDAIFKMNEEHPEFQALAEETYKYTDNLLTMMVENNMIAQSDADMIREIAPHWIPFNTVEGKIQPVFTTLAQETLKVQHQMSLNKFGIHLKNTLGTVVSENPMNVREFMNSIEKGGNLVHFGGNARYHTMTVLENGKAVTFEVTDEMYTALKPTRDILSASIPLLSHASTLRRNLITAYSPWFTAKNAIRDIQEVVVNSQHPLKTYATIPQAIKEIRQKGDFYQEYVKNGGEQNTYFDAESGEFGSGKGIMNALETKTGLSRILNANNFVEMVPRFAEYIASREAGASVEVSMLDAARVTTNFAAGGKVTKFLNRNGATFLNSSVQGALQQARNFAEAKQNGFKGWASLAARYTALGLPVVLLNNLIWDDDEDYQKLPDYITNNYYIVWKYGESSFVRLPKGRTAAVIQNAIKQVSADKADWKDFWNVLGENIAPNNPLEDNIFAPIIQVAMNKTWYDEDLVPNRLQKIDDVTQRFDEKTSRWAVKLSKRIEDSWLGDQVDLSPKQIHYLLDQYSGVLGDTLLPFTTPKAETGSDSILAKAFAPVKDIFTTDSVLNDRVTGEFYDTLEALEAKTNDPSVPRSERLQGSILIGYNVEISKLLQKQRDIQNSDMKDSEKYRLTRELKKEINALQEKALADLKDIRITGVYAEAGDKRYNYGYDKGSDGLSRWFEIKPTNADGSDNWYYQNEQEVTEMFALSPAEYWNNRVEYSAAYKAANHYDEPYFETVKNVLGIDDFADYAVGLSGIYADKDKNGNSISGSRKRKMKDYIYSLDIPEIEKHILFKAEYNYNKQHDREIRQYLESLDLSSSELSDVLDELGMK